MELIETHATVSARKTPFYINRNFALLWSGRTVSVLGDFVFNTTLILWIASDIARGATWAPLATSGIFLAMGIPVFLIGPFAGVFVDRWDKRQTMLWADILRAVLVASLLLAANLVPLPWIQGGKLSVLWQLGIIYTVLFCCSTCSQFFNSSRLALIGNLVPTNDRSRAIGMLQATLGMVSVIGPVLAALVLFSLGVQWALLLNASSFAISFLTLRAIDLPRLESRPGQENTGHFLDEFREGIRFFTSSGRLISLLIAILIATFGGVSLTTLGVYFVTNNLHIASNFFGVLDAVLGIGVVGGGLCVGVLTKRIGLERNLGLGMMAGGLALFVFARMTILLPALVFIFLFGVFLSIVKSAINTLLLHLTPPEFIGRIMSIFIPLETLASLFSTALVGFLVSTVLPGQLGGLLGMSFGRIDSIYTVAGILFFSGGCYALMKLRAREAPSISI